MMLTNDAEQIKNPVSVSQIVIIPTIYSKQLQRALLMILYIENTVPDLQTPRL